MERPFPAYNGDEPYVFVSYAHENDEVVYPEIQWLKDQGFNIWYDEGINPGSEWHQELADRIQGSSLFVYFVTPQSVSSEHCLREVHYAIDHGKQVLAVHLEETKLPSGVDLSLSSIQAILRHELSELDYRIKLLKGTSDHIQRGVALASELSMPSAGNRARLVSALAIGGVAIVVLALGYFAWDKFMVRPTQVATAEVTQVTITKNAGTQGVAEELASLEPSIAVLPFENLSQSKENEYIAAGIHEDILNNLSQIPELIVTSRTSTLAYAGSNKPVPMISRELNVNYVMEGSIRRAGDRVRISVQLIEAGRDKQIWSEGYDRDLIDVFEIQRDVARQVSHALKVHFDISQVAGENPTKSLQAYELFLEARKLASSFDPDNVENAIRKYREVLEIDPNYSDAWAGLAVALQSTSFFGKSDRQFEEAMIAADKTLTISPDSWLANYAKAQILGDESIGRYAEASEFYKRAIAINPNDGNLLTSYGFNLWFEGRATEAQEQFLAAYRRDPLSAIANLARAMVAIFDNERVNATKFINRALEIAPDSTYVNWWAGAAYNSMGEQELAALQFSRVLQQAPDHLAAMMWLSQIFGSLGDAEIADYWLDMVEVISPHNTLYMLNRADNYNRQRLPDKYRQHVRTWLAREPDNSQAQRYQSYATSQAAREAFDKEDLQGWRELNNQALNEAMAYLEATGDDGELVVRVFNSWSFLAAGIYAKNQGEQELATGLFRKVLDYHAAQPEGASIFRHLQLAVAQAALENPELAIDHMRTLRDLGFTSTWLFRAYGLTDDVYGNYAGINNNIAFKGAIADMEKINAEILAQLSEKAPNLFPPSL